MESKTLALPGLHMHYTSCYTCHRIQTRPFVLQSALGARPHDDELYASVSFRLLVTLARAVPALLKARSQPTRAPPPWAACGKGQ